MTIASNAPATSMRRIFSEQQQAFRKNPYPSARMRREWLQRLEKTILRHQNELAAELDSDFGGRSRMEILFSEIFVAVNSIRHAHRHVARWMSPRPRDVGWQLQPARAYILPQPVGVVGVIAAWNYPIFVSIAPLAGALAAGNRVMLKPSEITPRTSAVLERLLHDAFERDLVAVVTGDADVGREFASLPFDHLLFTGSTQVGRSIMRAASENLTPVTLELGGKSPAIVAEDADLHHAAEDIAYGKLLNAGQTCVAPDYVLVASPVLKPFLEAMQNAIERYYPDPARNAEYTAIVNDRHHARLQQYIAEARSRGASVIEIGPQAPAGVRKMTPALIVDPPDDLAVMREEIFGPILPVKPYNSIENAIDYINQRSRPLALYLFARNRNVIERVLTETVSGGVCVNDTLLHITVEDLPFGGIGPSGIGHYHGQDGFDALSKLKPVLRRRWPGLARRIRPPYGRMHDWLIRFLIR
jgi:acyl-CoA reductase-like NAD-dependent aldehyde dehydrogenase